MTDNQGLVSGLADLARLKLTPTESAKLGQEIPEILSYVEKLKQVDTVGVEPMARVGGAIKDFRVDEAREALPAEHQVVVQAFPEKVGDLLKVKPVFASRKAKKVE